MAIKRHADYMADAIDAIGIEERGRYPQRCDHIDEDGTHCGMCGDELHEEDDDDD